MRRCLNANVFTDAQEVSLNILPLAHDDEKSVSQVCHACWKAKKKTASKQMTTTLGFVS